jgi:GTP-binding protein
VDTKGEGILASRFLEFRPHVGEIKKRAVGSMISGENGKALGFSLANLQERGVLYINPGTEVYTGMVIGYTTKGEDMTVNPTKGKQLTNVRSSGTDEAQSLVPPIVMTLEQALEFIDNDELVEVTPISTRIRKKLLTENLRKQAGRPSKG